MANITQVTVTFGNGVKRNDYDPIKKAECSITAVVAEGEDGESVLAQLSHMALSKVADLLDAPKPSLQAVANASQQEIQHPGEAPARRTRGPNKPKDEAPAEPVKVETPTTEEPKPEPIPTAETPAEDDWSAGADDIVITDQELLSATSKRAGELGAREPIVKLIATFATRTEGPPFKVQEIPANQRKDYLAKLAALTA